MLTIENLKAKIEEKESTREKSLDQKKTASKRLFFDEG